jgi:hypothetical protein
VGTPVRDLTGAADLLAEVVLLRDRDPGRLLPPGADGAQGRAATLIRQGTFRDPGLLLDGDILAFLEAEPLQWGRDANGDGDAFDSFLRVFRRDTEITAGQTLVADAAPQIDGRPLARIGNYVLFRSSEAANARREMIRISESMSGGAAAGSSSAPVLSRDGRWIAFESRAGGLTDEPADGAPHVFIAEVDTGALQRIRLDYEERVDANAPATSPWFSGDGRVLALSAPDLDGTPQVWIYERDTDQDGVLDEPDATKMWIGSLSQQDREALGDGPSQHPTVNQDGRILAFHSRAFNLGFEGNDRVSLTYWHDRGDRPR